MIRYWAGQITVIMVVLVALVLLSIGILRTFPGQPQDQRVGFETSSEERW